MNMIASHPADPIVQAAINEITKIKEGLKNGMGVGESFSSNQELLSALNSFDPTHYSSNNANYKITTQTEQNAQLGEDLTVVAFSGNFDQYIIKVGVNNQKHVRTLTCEPFSNLN